MKIEDRYTAVPTASGGIRLIPKPIETMDAASRLQPVGRARTGDDLLTGNEPPRRISLGTTFTPSKGEAHHEPAADDEVRELQRGRNFALSEPVHAEDIGVVMKELGMEREQAVMLLGRLPKEAVGPFVDHLRDSAKHADARRNEMKLHEPVDSYKRTADSYARAQWEEFTRLYNAPLPVLIASPAATPLRGNPVRSFKEQLEAIAAHRNAQFDCAFGQAPTATAGSSNAAVRSSGNVVHDYKAAMEQYAAARSA